MKTTTTPPSQSSCFFVRPRVKTREHWVSFNCFNLTANHSYVLVGFFYANNRSSKQQQQQLVVFDDVVDTLKNSLSDVLVSFYPLAGRVFNRGDEEGEVLEQKEGERQGRGRSGQSALLCNDEGARFTAAHIDAQLKDSHNADLFRISGMPTAELESGPLYNPGTSGLPALIIQVSLFNCGGVAVAVNWHHQVADGYSAFHFLNSWAKLARGMGRGSGTISLDPIHRRSLLQSRDPPRITVPMDKYYDIGEKQLSQKPNPGQEREIASHCFRFSREKIADLVKRASESRPKRFTRAESVAGHIWRSVAKWRNLGAEDRIHFLSIVDGRKRFSDPPIGPGYFGNAICIARTSSTVGELLQQPLGYAANLVHGAFAGVMGEYLRSLMDWIALRGPENVFRGRDRVVGRDVRIVFWTHFPMFEIDFGWGPPDDAGVGSTALNPRGEGTALVMPGGPGDSGGSMVARICLHGDSLRSLATDPEFLLH